MENKMENTNIVSFDEKSKNRNFFTKIFATEDGSIQKTVRVIVFNGKIYFVAKDIAESLGYKDTNQAVRVNCKNQINVNSLQGGSKYAPNEIKALDRLDPQTVLIMEPDVFRLIMRSKKDEAEYFQDWVVTTVLPEIREKGSFNLEDREDAILAKIDVLLKTNISQLIDQKLEQFREPIKFKGFQAKTVIPCIDIATLSDRILEDFKIQISKNKIYSFMRDLNWIEKDSTMPTMFALKNTILGIELCPIVDYADGYIGKSVRTVIYKDQISDFIDFLKIKKVIPNYNLIG
jgi:prophage antirepressor-like protein